MGGGRKEGFLISALFLVLHPFYQKSRKLTHDLSSRMEPVVLWLRGGEGRQPRAGGSSHILKLSLLLWFCQGCWGKSWWKSYR